MKIKTKILISLISVIAVCSIALSLLFGLNSAGILRLISTPITIKIDDYSKTYDGEPIEDELLKYSILSGGFLAGDSLVLEVSDDTDAKNYSNELEYKIIDKNGLDVTSSYNINLDLGNIEILPKKLTVQSGTKVFGHDGEKHSYEECQIVDGYLVGGDLFKAFNFSTFTEPGYHLNNFSWEIINREGENVSHNYEVDCQLGYIIILEGEISGDIDIGGGGSGSGEDSFPEKEEVGGSQTDEVSEDLSESGGKYTSGGEKSFDTVFKYTPSKRGSSFFKMTTNGDYTKKGWNIAPKYKPKYGVNPQEFISDLLKDSGREFGGKLEYVAFKTRDFDMVPWFPKLDRVQECDTLSVVSNLEDSTIDVEGYVFDYINDYSLIENATFSNDLYVKEEQEYRNFVYDNYLSVPETTKEFLLDYIDQYNLEGADLLDTCNRIIANFKTDFFYHYKGMVDYLEDDVLVAFLDKYKVGDCSRFSGAGVLILRTLGYPARQVGGYGVPGKTVGKTYSVTPWASHAISEVYIDGKGWVGVEFTVAPLHPDCVYPPTWSLEDSNDTYDIVISSNDISKEYDGTPIIPSSDYSYTGTLKEGHTLIMNNTNSLYDCGFIENNVDYIILDSNFNDVTSEYKIQEDFGYLTLTQRQLTLITDNNRVSYSGNPINPTYSISGLAPGDRVEEITLYPVTQKGTTLAVATIDSIKNSKGQEVISNYEIRYVYGHIVVE